MGEMLGTIILNYKADFPLRPAYVLFHFSGVVMKQIALAGFALLSSPVYAANA